MVATVGGVERANSIIVKTSQHALIIHYPIGNISGKAWAYLCPTCIVRNTLQSMKCLSTKS